MIMDSILYSFLSEWNFFKMNSFLIWKLKCIFSDLIYYYYYYKISIVDCTIKTKCDFVEKGKGKQSKSASTFQLQFSEVLKKKKNRTECISETIPLRHVTFLTHLYIREISLKTLKWLFFFLHQSEVNYFVRGFHRNFRMEVGGVRVEEMQNTSGWIQLCKRDGVFMLLPYIVWVWEGGKGEGEEKGEGEGDGVNGPGGVVGWGERRGRCGGGAEGRGGGMEGGCGGEGEGRNGWDGTLHVVSMGGKGLQWIHIISSHSLLIYME